MKAGVIARLRRLTLVLLAALLAVTGCGNDGDEQKTPYGNAAKVRAYRDRIDAIVEAVNAIQDEMEQIAVGSTGQATGENLAAAAVRLKPQLLATLDLLDGIDPPARLADLHAEMRRLIQLRLEAFDQVSAGWEVEQADSFAEAEPFYDQAEGKLNEATALAARVNEELEEVDIALAEAEGGNPVA